MEYLLAKEGIFARLDNVKCITGIAKKEFDPNTLIIHSPHDVESAVIANNLAKQLTSDFFKILIFTTAATLKYSGEFYVSPSPSIIWIVNSMQDMNNFKQEITNVNKFMIWKSSSKIIILLSKGFLTEEVFLAFWSISRAVNILILTYDKIFYNWIPYQKGVCNKIITPLKIGSCINGNIKMLQAPFSVDKIGTNLNDCSIYATTSMVYPYVGFDSVTKAVKDGVEVQIVKTFVSKYNAVIEYKWLPAEEPFYQYTSTEPYNGAARYLQIYYVDMAFGSMFQSSQHSPYADVLKIPHSNDELAWFIPQPEETPAIKHLYIAFELDVWLLVLAILLSITLTVFATEISTYKRSEVGLQFLFGLAVTINYGVPMPKTFLQKTFLIFCFIYSLHIVTAYQSSLISFLTKPVMEKPLQSVHEGIERGLIPYMYEPHRPYIEKEGFPDQKEILKEGRHVFRKEMQFQFMKTFQDKMILGVKSTTLFYLTWLEKVDANKQLLVRTLQPGVLSFHVTILLTRGNPLKPKLDLTVQQLVESGLKEKWMRDLVKNNEKLIIKISADDNKPLTLTNLTGAFYIIVIGVISACFTFLLEILAMRAKRNRLVVKKPKIPERQRCRHTSQRVKMTLVHPNQTKS